MNKKQIQNLNTMVQSIATGYMILFADRNHLIVKIFGWWQLGIGLFMLLCIFFLGIVTLLAPKNER